MHRFLPTIRPHFTAQIIIALGATPAFSQVQTDKLYHASAFSLSGVDLSLDGDSLAVGSNGEVVHIYNRSNDAWVLEQTLTHPEGDEFSEFGNAVALQSDMLLVGAPSDDGRGEGAGAVFIYEREGGQWNFSDKLLGADTTIGHHFGRSVALDAGRALIGAPLIDDSGEDSGAAYVFEFTGGILGWLQLARLTDPAAAEFARFGTSLAIDGELAVIAADGDSTVAPGGGSALIFRRLATGWVLETKLIPDDTNFLQSFGSSVDLAAGKVAIGAHADDEAGSGAGAVYTYVQGRDGWELEQKLLSAQPSTNAKFGQSLALDANQLAIGSSSPLAGVSGAGAVEIFEHDGQGWSWSANLLPGAPSANSSFGAKVDISGDRVASGTPLDSEGASFAGAVYLYSRSQFAAAYCFCDVGAPCNNEDAHGGCATSSGNGARLSASGSGSVSADDLMLVATGLPVNQPAIFCVGAGRQRSVFSDGQFCVSDVGGIKRFPIEAASASGVLELGPDLAGYSAQHFGTDLEFAPGVTRHFQVWFRDPGGPCGNHSNLSHGLSVSFGL